MRIPNSIHERDASEQRRYVNLEVTHTTHGRVWVVFHVQGTDGKLRLWPKAGIAVQDVATCAVAVAVSFNYAGGEIDEQE